MTNRSSRIVRIGAVMVVVAGIGLLVGTFLPWTTASFDRVDGREDTDRYRGVGSFSGWDLIVDCAHREAPSVCVIEDPTTLIQSDWIPTRVTSGEWSLVLGGATTAVGIAILLALRRRRRCPPTLLAIGWLVAFADLVGTVAMFATLLDQPNGPNVMHTGFGVVVIATSATLGIVAMTVVQIGASGPAQLERAELVSSSAG